MVDGVTGQVCIVTWPADWAMIERTLSAMCPALFIDNLKQTRY